MGFMPNVDRVKTALDWRFEYLAKSPDARDFVKKRLEEKRDPFDFARKMEVNRVKINVIDDDMKDFANKLDQIFGAPQVQAFTAKTIGQLYMDDQARGHGPNQDTDRNRQAVVAYWGKNYSDSGRDSLTHAIRVAVRQELDDGTPMPIKYYWQCQKAPGELPGGSHQIERDPDTGKQVVVVLFQTDATFYDQAAGVFGPCVPDGEAR